MKDVKQSTYQVKATRDVSKHGWAQCLSWGSTPPLHVALGAEQAGHECCPEPTEALMEATVPEIQ